MTTLCGLKIVSPCLVTFAKLFRVSRIQWFSSAEQEVFRNSLVKGTGSQEGRAVLVPRSQERHGFGRGIKYSSDTQNRHHSRAWLTSFYIFHILLTACSCHCNLGFITEQIFLLKYFLLQGSCLCEHYVQCQCQERPPLQTRIGVNAQKMIWECVYGLCLCSSLMTRDPSTFSTTHSTSHAWGTLFL